MTTRVLTVNEYMDPYGHPTMMLLNGQRWHMPVTEKPILDTVEIWSLVNLTSEVHPIHLHQARVRILDRQGFDAPEYLRSQQIRYTGPRLQPEAYEAGSKDTVRANGVLLRACPIRRLSGTIPVALPHSGTFRQGNDASLRDSRPGLKEQLVTHYSACRIASLSNWLAFSTTGLPCPITILLGSSAASLRALSSAVGLCHVPMLANGKMVGPSLTTRNPPTFVSASPAISVPERGSKNARCPGVARCRDHH